jgi:hypothetical protein
MKLAIGMASCAVHMVLLFAVMANMFVHRRGYHLFFPEQDVERVDRFYVTNYSCICPRNLAERRRYSQTPMCLRSQCDEGLNRSRVET